MKRLIWRKKLFLILTFASILLFMIVINSLTITISTKQDVIPEYTSGQMKQMLDEAATANKERINRIERTCKKYNLGLYRSNNNSSSFKYPPTPQYSVFYFDVDNKLAYCPIYKAGSTTWLYNLLALHGVGDEKIKGKQISEVARVSFPKLDGDDAENVLSESQRLLCVRHPLERVLSAYRDKLEDKDRAPQDGTLHYYRRWGRRIRARYREDGRPEPTFPEFVRYLIETDLLLYADDHWIPYNAYCTPCLLRYDFVAKVETLMADQIFFAQSMNLQLTPRAKHSSPKFPSASYFTQITKEQIHQLYAKFQLDFEMFGYSIEPYLSYAKK